MSSEGDRCSQDEKHPAGLYCTVCDVTIRHIHYSVPMKNYHRDPIAVYVCEI
jgi:hypothetical protein